MKRGAKEAPAPPSAEPAIQEAFKAFCHWFGFSFPLTGRVSQVISIGDIDGDPLRAIPGRLHRALLKPEATVHIVDLHGQRAREAESLLDHLEGDVAIVFFGKGKGVLRNVFLRVMGAQESWVVVGYSGHTLDEDVPGVGVVATRALHDRCVAELRDDADASDEIAPVRPKPKAPVRAPKDAKPAKAGARVPARKGARRRRQPARSAPLWKRVILFGAIMLLIALLMPVFAAWVAVLFSQF